MRKNNIINTYNIQVAIFVLLLFILSIGLLLRSGSYFYGDFNYSLDQSRDLLLTRQIVNDHNLTLIGARAGAGGIFHGPLWLYIISPFYILAKGDPFYTLIPLFLIINLIPILLAYKFGSSLYNRKIGLTWAFFVSISSSLIGTSFNTSNAQMMPMVFLIYLFYVLRYLRGNDRSLIYILFSIGIAFQFESAFAIFLFPLTLVALIVRGKLPSVKNFITGLLMFVLAISSFILFELRHQFLMSKSVLNIFKGSLNPIGEYAKFSDLSFRIIDRLGGLFNYFTSPLFQNNPFYTVLIFSILVFAIYLHLNKSSKRLQSKQFIKEYFFIFSIPFLYYFIFTFYPSPLWIQYNLALTISASLLISLSINKIFSTSRSKHMLGLTLLLFSFPSLLWIRTNYVFNKPIQEYSNNYKNQLSIAEYIMTDSKNNKEVGYFVYDSGFLTYNMDYLMLFLGDKYGKITVNKKLPITYLILYPAPIWDVGAHDYWIKKVINTKGRITHTKKFENNIIVKKLTVPPNDPSPDPNYFQNLIFR